MGRTFNEDQRADQAVPTQQDDMPLLFYDEGLHRALAKRVTIAEPEAVANVLVTADRLLAAIPIEGGDFDRAKAEVLAVTDI